MNATTIRLALAFVPALSLPAAGGCRCSKSTPGEIGKATTALEAIPGDVDALVVFDTEGLRQGSLGDLAFRPLVVRAFREWGGAKCEALVAVKARSAALGIRLPRGGASGSRQFFLAAEGPTIDDVRGCLDERGAREGLSSVVEDIDGGRGVTDGRGFHVFASGPDVVAISFPFGKRDVLAQAVPVAFGRQPSVASTGAFQPILDRVGGDLTIALSETRDLFREYGAGLRERLAAAVPQDLCASVDEIRSAIQAARLFGFGELAGISRMVDAWFPDGTQVCAADAIRRIFDHLATLRAGAISVTGRDDVVVVLALVFSDAGVAEDLRALFADLLGVMEVAPDKLDLLERLPFVAENLDIARIREALRSPLLKHLAARGEGDSFEFEIRIEASDARTAVEAVQGLANNLVTR